MKILAAMALVALIVLCPSVPIYEVAKGGSPEQLAKSAAVRIQSIGWIAWALVGRSNQIRIKPVDYYLRFDVEDFSAGDAGPVAANESRTYLQIPVDELEALRGRINQGLGRVVLKIPAQATVVAQFVEKRESEDGRIADWYGVTQQGRIVQITSIWPDAVVVTVAEERGVISITPVATGGGRHVLAIPGAQSNHRGPLLISSKFTAIPCDEEVDGRAEKGPDDHELRVRISIDTRSRVAKLDDAAYGQLQVLNYALARAKAGFYGVLQPETAAEGVYEAARSAAVCGTPLNSATENDSAQPMTSIISAFKNNEFDLAVLVTDLSDASCGDSQEGALPICGKVLSGVGDAPDFLAVIDSECLHASRGVLAHEVGHLLGARHEWNSDHGGERHNHGTEFRTTPTKVESASRFCVTAKGRIWGWVPESWQCAADEVVRTGTIDTSGFVTEKVAAFSTSGRITCNDRRLDEFDPGADDASVIQMWGSDPTPLSDAETCNCQATTGARDETAKPLESVAREATAGIDLARPSVKAGAKKKHQHNRSDAKFRSL